MKKRKPGQIYTLHNCVYRLHKREDGCKGCEFDNLLICPDVVDVRSERKLNCVINGIILKKDGT